MLFLFCSLAIAELHAPQAFLENALFADAPEEGLTQIAGVVPGIVSGSQSLGRRPLLHILA